MWAVSLCRARINFAIRADVVKNTFKGFLSNRHIILETSGLLQRQAICFFRLFGTQWSIGYARQVQMIKPRGKRSEKFSAHFHRISQLKGRQSLWQEKEPLAETQLSTSPSFAPPTHTTTYAWQRQVRSVKVPFTLRWHPKSFCVRWSVLIRKTDHQWDSTQIKMLRLKRFVIGGTRHKSHLTPVPCNTDNFFTVMVTLDNSNFVSFLFATLPKQAGW